MEKIVLNMTSGLRRKSNNKRKLDWQLYKPREILKAAETKDTHRNSHKCSPKRTRSRKANDPGCIKTPSCHYIAHSDDLDAFLDKFAYPQSMDANNLPEIDMTSAFEQIGTVSVQVSAADFQLWTQKHKEALAHQYTSRSPRRATKRNIFISHADDQQVFTAPRRARHQKASMSELESLYGPQQLISNVFHKRQISTQEQFLVRWMPTFMLKQHINTYRKALYVTDEVQEVKGYLHHNAPALCVVSWKDSWEPGDMVQKLQHLDGDVMSIDQRALTSVTRRLWAESKDLHLHNLDRQSFKGMQDCSAANPFNKEPFLRNFVTIKTGDTLNPDLDIAPQGAYVIRADPRPPPQSEPQADNVGPPRPIQLLVVYGPDGKAIGTITMDRLLTLYKSYEQTSANRHDTSHDAFPHAVASLIQRYREGRQTEGYRIQMKNYWTIPESLMSAIRRGFHVATERFACPLNFNAAMTNYFSPFPEDRAFGATHDAYSCKWLGPSHAHPEHTSEDMQKAVRWALASAEQRDLPSLTVFTLPFSERCTTSYQQFLHNPMVHSIAMIPRRAIRMQMPTAWTDGKVFENIRSMTF